MATATPFARAAGRRSSGDALLLAAPLAALVAGVSAEWLDFRALRYPLLLLVSVGVVSTASVAFRGGAMPHVAALTITLGVLTWAAAEMLYVLLHLAQGERFDAPRFGPQPLQALGLIGVHGLFLGAPTGAVAAALLAAARKLRPG